jgi:hypothetical protein
LDAWILTGLEFFYSLNAAIKGARVFARPAHGFLWAIFDCFVIF